MTVLSTVRPNLHITGHNVVVCVCVLSAQCLVPKTDQVADKQRNTQLPYWTDNLGIVQVFLTLRPEIPTLGAFPVT